MIPADSKVQIFPPPPGAILLSNRSYRSLKRRSDRRGSFPPALPQPHLNTLTGKKKTLGFLAYLLEDIILSLREKEKNRAGERKNRRK